MTNHYKRKILQTGGFVVFPPVFCRATTQFQVNLDLEAQDITQSTKTKTNTKSERLYEEGENELELKMSRKEMGR
jgi:hypothetical protein